MSALGQKQTSDCRPVMSALPSIATSIAHSPILMPPWRQSNLGGPGGISKNRTPTDRDRPLSFLALNYIRVRELREIWPGRGGDERTHRFRIDGTGLSDGIAHLFTPLFTPTHFLRRKKLGKCLRHKNNSKKCLTYPRKRTSLSTAAMSALCQKRKSPQWVPIKRDHRCKRSPKIPTIPLAQSNRAS
jgi:hypothetical protein